MSNISSQQNFSEFVKNSEVYESGKYEDNSPDIDINNLTVDINTFIKLLEIIEYWKPYKPYPNQISIFLAPLIEDD